MRKDLKTIIGELIFCAVIAIVVGVLSGCAGTSQYIAARESSGKVAIEAANDNIVTGIKDATCALPYGTLLRHPELQPAAQSICGATASPASLLPSASIKAQPLSVIAPDLAPLSPSAK